MKGFLAKSKMVRCGLTKPRPLNTWFLSSLFIIRVPFSYYSVLVGGPYDKKGKRVPLRDLEPAYVDNIDMKRSPLPCKSHSANLRASSRRPKNPSDHATPALLNPIPPN